MLVSVGGVNTSLWVWFVTDLGEESGVDFRNFVVLAQTLFKVDQRKFKDGLSSFTLAFTT